MDLRVASCLCSLHFLAAEFPMLTASRATWLGERKSLDSRDMTHLETFPKELILLLPVPHCYFVTTMFALRILGNA